jgi:hypothetical protein
LLLFCKDVGALKDAQHRHTPTRGATAAQISPLWNGIDRSHSAPIVRPGGWSIRPLDDSAAEQADHASVDMHQCHLMPINTNIADRKARPHNMRPHNSHPCTATMCCDGQNDRRRPQGACAAVA